jgi:pimeloyl-ACP methyl ester carboxylesterase
MHAGFDETDRSRPVHDGRDKPAIMLVHGMWSRPHVWDNFRQFLEARNYRVVVPTLRHHDGAPGAMPHPELGTMSLVDYLADLASEIGRLGGKPLVIGHSMGGLLAHMLAARGLARAVIGLAPAQNAGVINHDVRSAWIFRREFMKSRFWAIPQLPTFKAMQYGVLNRLAPREQEELYASLQPESGRAMFEIGMWYFDSKRTTWINPDDVACPMLFMTGTEDKLTPLWLTQRLAEPYGTQLRVEALKGHAHWLPAESGWERIAERCVRFFEKDAPEMARQMVPETARAIGQLAPAR